MPRKTEDVASFFRDDAGYEAERVLNSIEFGLESWRGKPSCGRRRRLLLNPAGEVFSAYRNWNFREYLSATWCSFLNALLNVTALFSKCRGNKKKNRKKRTKNDARHLFNQNLCQRKKNKQTKNYCAQDHSQVAMIIFFTLRSVLRMTKTSCVV